MVVANTLVVAMVALAVALIAGIFFIEIDWGESDSFFWSSYGACVNLNSGVAYFRCILL